MARLPTWPRCCSSTRSTSVRCGCAAQLQQPGRQIGYFPHVILRARTQRSSCGSRSKPTSQFLQLQERIQALTEERRLLGDGSGSGGIGGRAAKQVMNHADEHGTPWHASMLRFSDAAAVKSNMSRKRRRLHSRALDALMLWIRDVLIPAAWNGIHIGGRSKDDCNSALDPY